MKRERFVKLVEEALDSLPARFRRRIQNVAVVVEDYPPRQASGQAPGQKPPGSGALGEDAEGLLLGVFEGVPTTEKSAWDTSPPDRIVLYQKNIETVARALASRSEEHTSELQSPLNLVCRL